MNRWRSSRPRSSRASAPAAARGTRPPGVLLAAERRRRAVGQVFLCGPLSVESWAKVFSAMPCGSSKSSISRRSCHGRSSCRGSSIAAAGLAEGLGLRVRKAVHVRRVSQTKRACRPSPAVGGDLGRGEAVVVAGHHALPVGAGPCPGLSVCRLAPARHHRRASWSEARDG